jgi:DNA topoisomerase-3
MRVYLCEKPDVAKSIVKFLGTSARKDGFLELENGDAVTWCIGHLLEMADPDEYDPEFKKWEVSHLPIIPEDGDWKMRIKPSTRKQFAVVKKLLSRASTVVIGCDIGREGELIGREIIDYCKFKGDVQRLWLNSMDDESIKFALSNLRPGSSSYNSSLSALGRSRADWLVGINLTRLVTLKAQASGLSGIFSCGRIQSPALNFFVVRDREIEKFVPAPYFVLAASFLTSENARFKGVFQCVDDEQLDEDGRCINETFLKSIASRVSDTDAEVSSIDSKRSKVQPPLPLSLSALQIEASRKWGYGVKQTLDIAQVLYEKFKVTTYPRVDCRYLPEGHFDKAGEVVGAVLSSIHSFGSLRDQFLLDQKSRAWNDKKISEHHAIIPTSVVVDMDVLSAEQKNIYQLICRFYLAQFLTNHVYVSTAVVLQTNSGSFLAKGNQVVVPGWKVMFGHDSNSDDDDSNQDLPALNEGDKVSIINPQVSSKLTKPPAHFTEGTWISAMLNAARFVSDAQLKKLLKETSGLGTEATRASIFEILIDRKYVVRSGKFVKSTPLGRALVDALPSIIKDPGMSALWEQALDDISTGNMTLDSFMNKQKAAIKQLMGHIGTVALSVDEKSLMSPVKVSRKAAPKSKKVCTCGAIMVQKNGEFGKFYGCTTYPVCKITIPIGKPKQQVKA